MHRTNNVLESLFHAVKRGERRRSGRKVLTKDFEDLPAAAALARNLNHPDYVDILCGSLAGLPEAFAQLDAKQRILNLRIAAGSHQDASAVPSLPASASLPREDRSLVRSDAMLHKIAAAATSRAPRAISQCGR